MKNKILKSKLFLYIFTGALALLCSGALAYGQEQNIAESFGLCSKGIDYYHEGKLYEAKDILEQAVRLDPRNDDALGYLDLVNAEIGMRSKGGLNSYQGLDELKRESDFNSDSYSSPDPEGGEILSREWEGKDEPEPQMVHPEEPYDNEEYVDDEPAVTKVKGKGKIRGEYKMSVGVTREDVIWKKANGDYNERNFRIIDEHFPKVNTYDTRVFDRLKVVFDTNTAKEGLNLHSDITVDPWSFVGKTEKFTITSVNGDLAELELKYWSGTRSTINETFFSQRDGNAFSTPEIKVKDGEIDPLRVAGGLFTDTFPIPRKKINFEFQPIRELWVDFKGEDNNLRIFPMGLQDQALTSDDPLGFSNHHIYWEASPWLYDWIPGNVNTGANPDDFWRGKWSDSLAHFTRDSDLTRLTALRGVSFKGEFLDTSSVAATVATPKTLWQDYDNVTAIPGAVRVKSQVTDSLTIGSVDTFRIGYAKDSIDSYNNVIGLDMKYDLDSETSITAEGAISKTQNDRSNSTFETSKNGSAGQAALKKETSVGKLNIAFTHMDKAFDPGLSNYKQTRRDQFWGRHIHFKKPLESNVWFSPTLKYYDIEPFRIGDGIDTGRDVFNIRLDKKDAFNKKMDNLIDFRRVNGPNDKYIETVAREENTFRIDKEWTSKLLFLYHDLPKTKGGIDPIQYDSVTGEFLKNIAIEDGKDPSVYTYSGGLEYAPEEWLSFFGIVENTNDFRFATGSYPNGLFNSTFVDTEVVNRKVYRIQVPQLYNQFYFDTPPYDRFNIYRVGMSVRPSPGLGIELDYTKNDFKFAQSIDDNMNHLGAGLSYEFNKKLTGFLKYTFSRAYNMYRLNNDNGTLQYRNHHNVFMELDYSVSEYGFLVIQFGEGSVISPVWSATASPFGDFYPTLDTQHILRIYYNGRF